MGGGGVRGGSFKRFRGVSSVEELLQNQMVQNKVIPGELLQKHMMQKQVIPSGSITEPDDSEQGDSCEGSSRSFDDFRSVSGRRMGGGEEFELVRPSKTSNPFPSQFDEPLLGVSSSSGSGRGYGPDPALDQSQHNVRGMARGLCRDGGGAAPAGPRRALGLAGLAALGAGILEAIHDGPRAAATR